jgi:hypothetical protein
LRTQKRPALLVVGYRTDRRNGEDIAVKLSPILAERNLPSRYESVIGSRIYLSVRGLSIERIGIDDTYCIVLIYMPAQKEDDKPFLLHGAVVEGRVERTFFSIVRRRGDGSVPITAREIHAYLSTGRRLRP